MIDAVINARDQDDYIDAVRAYDRVLLSGSYTVPLYFKPEQWIAHWHHIKRPPQTPLYGSQLPAWWYEPT